MSHHDNDATRAAEPHPANRLGLDYRVPPPRKVDTPIIDAHVHVLRGPTVGAFFEAATLYGVTKVVAMTPLDEVDELRAAYPGRLGFIAIPRWRNIANSSAFQAEWIADLAAFRERSARRMKLWMAPPMRAEHGLTLDHAFLQPVIRAALDLGYDFMVHVGDPTAWFAPGGRYAAAARFGTKREQYPQLEFFLEAVAPRTVIAAHMGGYIEEPAFLQDLLDRHPNLYLDSSATKWVVREIARQPEVAREFMLRNQERILFGSDLVVAETCDFDHYASRYWTHQIMWETAYRGESPIADPDGPDPPRLAGLDLPPPALRRLYSENAVALGY